jgi:hypothetical protein
MLAGGLAGSRTGGAAPQRASVPEESLASLRLDTPLPPGVRCPKAVISTIETTHQFRVRGGAAGRDQDLLVTTECLKRTCASDAENTISRIVVTSKPDPAPICEPKTPMSLATSKGLRLGDSEERTRSLKGEPRRAFRKHGAPSVFHYAGHSGPPGDEGDDVGFMVAFDAGKIKWMELFVDTDPHEDDDP